MKMTVITSRLSRMALAATVATAILPVSVGCNQLEDDDHYANTDIEVNNKELSFVNEKSEEVLGSRSEFTAMDNLFKKYGIYDELAKKGQLATILVVDNSDMDLGRADFVANVSEEYLVRSHISDIAISPSNLKDGDRLMMWHGKFVNISVDDEGREGHIAGHVSFNNGVVKECIKTANGYIYVISDMVKTPTALYEYIEQLPDDYSRFRDMFLATNTLTFDRDNSKAIGVNDEGNTVYDSIFTVKNDYFEKVGVDITSEALTATLLLPSNDVIDAAVADAKERLAKWRLERDDDFLYKWILDACFLKKRYTLEQLQDPTEGNSYASMFSNTWRTDIQKMTGEEEIGLSNAVVHKVAKLHIPTNALIYRLKSYFYYYELCTADQVADFFQMNNMALSGVRDGNSAFSPLEALWPAVTYRLIDVKPGIDGADASFSLDFTPIRTYIDENGNTKAEAFLIPPGAYKFTMGSEQNASITLKVSVIVNGETVAYTPEVTFGTATTYHYDRGAGGYPEGFDTNEVTALGGSKAGNYDRDGGPVISEVVIPDVNGDGSAVRVCFRFAADNWQGKNKFPLHSWCLKPTVNNY